MFFNKILGKLAMAAVVTAMGLVGVQASAQTAQSGAVYATFNVWHPTENQYITGSIRASVFNGIASGQLATVSRTWRYYSEVTGIEFPSPGKAILHTSGYYWNLSSPNGVKSTADVVLDTNNGRWVGFRVIDVRQRVLNDPLQMLRVTSSAMFAIMAPR